MWRIRSEIRARCVLKDGIRSGVRRPRCVVVVGGNIDGMVMMGGLVFTIL